MVPSIMDIFYIRIDKHLLIYAPLHQIVLLVNESAAREIRDALFDQHSGWANAQPFIQQLRRPAVKPGLSRQGVLDPLFLGLVPTRGCNLNCQYCDFVAPKQTSPVMELSLARRAIDSYLRLLQAGGRKDGEIHFFGGEPFFAEAVVHFAVEYAAWRAGEAGLDIYFKVTTNGLFDACCGLWIADHFDGVTLSLDGPRDIQERQRPSINGKQVFDRITASARLLSDSSVELVLRACVTDQSVARLPEIAGWFAQEFRPGMVCFETLVPGEISRVAGLQPPDPWEFAGRYYQAQRILTRQGIRSVFSTADLNNLQTSFCPVGKDVLIVSPDGSVDACYVLRETWEQRGLDFHLGQVGSDQFELGVAVLQNVREMSVESKPLCANCFCRYHCAGGCHVNHDTNVSAGQFDAQCIQTRLITTALLLDRLGQYDLAQAWLADRRAMEVSVWAPTDRLVDEQSRR